MADAPAGRLKAVREEQGLTQLQFLPILNAAARKLGLREYTQSSLSRIETGRQEATFDDVAVWELADPEQRGKLWLGWGEDAERARVPVLPPLPQGETLRQRQEREAREKGRHMKGGPAGRKRA